jgi:hypothetical protein
MSIIILTTTVNVQDKCFLFQTNPVQRLNTYIHSIKKWINNTSLKIIVVENSGYQFDELREFISDRFEIICFNEKELPEANYLINNNSKGASELFSIYYSIHNSKIIDSSDFIIKITGRYFVPNFEEYLFKINLNDFDGIIQNNCHNCEILGCHYNKKDIIFDKNNSDYNHIEFLYKIRIEKLNKVIILPEFKINPTQIGGLNEIRYSL